MSKKTRSIIMIAMIMLLGFIMPVSALAATKKSDTTYYYTCMSGQKDGIYSMELKGNKLIIKGTFAKSSSSSNVSEKYFSGKTLKYKKTTFVLAKNCKFYATGGEDGKVAYTRGTFKECYVTQPDLGLGFLVKVKNGKVVSITTES